MDKRWKWAIAAQVGVFFIWVGNGIYHLSSGVDAVRYIIIWLVLLMYIILAALNLYWDGKREQTQKEICTATEDILEKYRVLHMINCKTIGRLLMERDALLAIVAKDGLCETCKHHKTCVYEDGPIEMDCVGCEREDCKCAGCTSKNDHWEWVGVKEEEHGTETCQG